MRRRKHISFRVALTLMISGFVSADESKVSVFQTGQNAFSLPLPNISRENKRAHVVGNSFFNNNWVIAPASAKGRDGLGPLFHARSCSGCHTRDGRGSPPEKGELITSLLFRVSIPGKGPKGEPIADPNYGNQIAPRANPGSEPKGDVKIDYEEVPGKFTDGTAFSLRKPVYTFLPNRATFGEPAKDLLLSPRISPPVFGVGLLEAVAEETILGFADPDDKNSDGISGRPNFVWNLEAKTHQLGRFGWKANQPDVRQQTASAFLGDIGITTSIHRDDGSGPQSEPEADDHVLQRIVTYQQTLAPPARRDRENSEIIHGEQLFHEAKCTSCHIPEMKTGSHSEIAELSNQVIEPFTDLLLHDLGEGLADGRSDFEATGNEWRTAPLWGIGLTKTVNGHTNFLHDGRARNVVEAILWHGGEAEASADGFRKMNAKDRAALVAFLDSL